MDYFHSIFVDYELEVTTVCLKKNRTATVNMI